MFWTPSGVEYHAWHSAAIKEQSKDFNLGHVLLQRICSQAYDVLMHPPGSPWESHFLSHPHFSFLFFFFFFHFYMSQLDLSYLLISKCIITGLMFMSFSDCHKDSCFVGTATFLAPGIQSDIWWMPRKYSLNGEMNCTNLSYLLITRSYCRKIRWAFSPLSLASWGPCPEDKDLLV